MLFAVLKNSYILRQDKVSTEKDVRPFRKKPSEICRRMRLSPEHVRKLDGLNVILRSPSLSIDATDKAFQDNKRSSFAKIGSFKIRSPLPCDSCILQQTFLDAMDLQVAIL
nr:hypothetical protein CFP56_15111 [Quercus suber]